VEVRFVVPLVIFKAASAATVTLTVVVPVLVPNCACATDAVTSRRIGRNGQALELLFIVHLRLRY